MKNAIQFAAEHANISKNDFEVILHGQKSLLFHSNQPWIKRDTDTFDVAMGAYDGAKISELVAIFMLSLLSRKFSSNKIGLYRHDGLAVFGNISGRQAEKRNKKTIQNIFKDKYLQIIIKCNLKTVDHLDVTLNLNDGTYRPFHKTNEETNYIHVKSDYPRKLSRKSQDLFKKIIPPIFNEKNI